VLFSTFFALLVFAIALIVRQITIRELWRPQAEILSRFYTAALVIPALACKTDEALVSQSWITVTGVPSWGVV
jgi:hypothetical protein